MENLKKKRSEVRGDGRISGKKIRAKKERSNGGVTVDDAEFEEFFTILKRLQTGYNYFRKKSADDCGDKSAAQPPATSLSLWNPAFELEDFDHVDDGNLTKSNGKTLRNDTVVGFDLNADPVTGQKSN